MDGPAGSQKACLVIQFELRKLLVFFRRRSFWIFFDVGSILGGFWKPKWKPKSIFGQVFFDVFFDCVLASILGGFLHVFQEPTFKIHAPTQCFVDFYSVSPFPKKSPKITENSPKILSKSLPKPPKIEQKSQKIVTKIQDNLRCLKKSKK